MITRSVGLRAYVALAFDFALHHFRWDGDQALTLDNDGLINNSLTAGKGKNNRVRHDDDDVDVDVEVEVSLFVSLSFQKFLFVCQSPKMERSQNL